MTIFPRLQLEGGNPVLFLGIMDCRKPTLWLSHGILFAFFLKVKRASLIAQLVKNLHAMQETPVWFLVGKIPWRRDRLPTPVFLSFPCGSVGKESTCNVGDLGSVPGLGRSPGEGRGYPLQYSWASLVAQLVKNPPAMRETWVWSLGRCPGEGKGYPLQHSGLENPMN